MQRAVQSHCCRPRNGANASCACAIAVVTHMVAGIGSIMLHLPLLCRRLDEASLQPRRVWMGLCYSLIGSPLSPLPP